jgi:hypothetical protein
MSEPIDSIKVCKRFLWPNAKHDDLPPGPVTIDKFGQRNKLVMKWCETKAPSFLSPLRSVWALFVQHPEYAVCLAESKPIPDSAALVICEADDTYNDLSERLSATLQAIDHIVHTLRVNVRECLAMALKNTGGTTAILLAEIAKDARQLEKLLVDVPENDPRFVTLMEMVNIALHPNPQTPVVSLLEEQCALLDHAARLGEVPRESAKRESAKPWNEKYPLVGTRSHIKDFPADWWLPGSVTERWQTDSYPLAVTADSVQQWLATQQELLTASIAAGDKNFAEHLERLVDNDVRLIAMHRPDLVRAGWLKSKQSDLEKLQETCRQAYLTLFSIRGLPADNIDWNQDNLFDLAREAIRNEADPRGLPEKPAQVRNAEEAFRLVDCIAKWAAKEIEKASKDAGGTDSANRTLPPSVYQLMEFIDSRPSRQVRDTEIPEELRNALIIALHDGLVEQDKPPQLPKVVPPNMTAEARQRWGKLAAAFNQASANPTYYLSEKGRYDLAQHREAIDAAGRSEDRRPRTIDPTRMATGQTMEKSITALFARKREQQAAATTAQQRHDELRQKSIARQEALPNALDGLDAATGLINGKRASAEAVAVRLIEAAKLTWPDGTPLTAGFTYFSDEGDYFPLAKEILRAAERGDRASAQAHLAGLAGWSFGEQREVWRRVAQLLDAPSSTIDGYSPDQPPNEKGPELDAWERRQPGYGIEGKYLNLTLDFTRDPAKMIERYPAVVTHACQLFHHANFEQKTLDRLTAWLKTQHPGTDVFLRTIEEVTNELAEAATATGPDDRASATGTEERPASEAPAAPTQPATATAGMTWQEAAKRLRRLREQGEPWTSYETLAGQIGCSKATVHKAVNQTKELQSWAKRQAAPRAQQGLDCPVLDNTVQQRELNPEDDAAIREYLEREDLTPDERAFFNGLSRNDQLDFLDDPDKHQRTFPKV